MPDATNSAEKQTGTVTAAEQIAAYFYPALAYTDRIVVASDGYPMLHSEADMRTLVANAFLAGRDYESRSPDGDGQAMIGVSVTEQSSSGPLPTPNSPQLADDARPASGSCEGRSRTHSALMAARQTEAGSEPADSLPSPPEPLVKEPPSERCGKTERG